MHGGFVAGFQWVNGSFCEQLAAREPNDVDLVTFLVPPPAADLKSVAARHPELFDPRQTKRHFLCDVYFLRLSPDGYTDSPQGQLLLLTAERLDAAVDRVTIESREEADQPLPGVFMGVLHASRSFEHKLGSGEVIRGKADPNLDVSTLVDWDLKPCIAHVRVVRWTRAGREHKRFTLRRLEASSQPS